MEVLMYNFVCPLILLLISSEMQDRKNPRDKNSRQQDFGQIMALMFSHTHIKWHECFLKKYHDMLNS